MTQDGPPRKPRHRRRATAAAGPPQPPAPAKAAPAAAAPKATSTKSPRATPPKAGSSKRRNDGERGLRDLAGAGSSQVGVSRALRARDVNRPTADDLARAEAELHVVRRNWKPQS